MLWVLFSPLSILKWKWKLCCHVQLCDSMDYIVHEIIQPRILEWAPVPFSRGLFPTQGSNPGLPHCRWILYQLSHQESPRVLEWVAYLFSSGSSWPRNQTGVSCIAGGFFTNWTIREASMMMVSTAMSPTGTMLFWTQHSSEETIARTNETLQTMQTILQLTCLQTF